MVRDFASISKEEGNAFWAAKLPARDFRKGKREYAVWKGVPKIILKD